MSPAELIARLELREQHFRTAAEGEHDAELLKAARLALAAEPADTIAPHPAFWQGMEMAAMLCGSLAETTYDDADGFAAATGCEAAIMHAVRCGRLPLKPRTGETESDALAQAPDDAVDQITRVGLAGSTPSKQGRD